MVESRFRGTCFQTDIDAGLLNLLFAILEDSFLISFQASSSIAPRRWKSHKKQRPLGSGRGLKNPETFLREHTDLQK